jgi:hypothetical protein
MGACNMAVRSMSSNDMRRARELEGRYVNVALKDGSRIDDCQLVSWGRNQAKSLWLFTNGTDTFVSLGDVVDLWEAGPATAKVA